MKGKAMSLMSRMGAVVGLSMLALTARAEYVQCDTPFSSGIPLQSLSRPTLEGLPNLTNFVEGSSLDVTSFNIASAGQLTVKLSDIKMPDALSELSLLVTDLNGVWERLDAAGTTASLLMNVSGPTQLFAAVFAQSADGSHVGLYNLQASFAPVPLPAAAWLLLSGLFGVGLTTRRRRQ